MADGYGRGGGRGGAVPVGGGGGEGAGAIAGAPEPGHAVPVGAGRGAGAGAIAHEPRKSVTIDPEVLVDLKLIALQLRSICGVLVLTCQGSPRRLRSQVSVKWSLRGLASNPIREIGHRPLGGVGVAAASLSRDCRRSSEGYGTARNPRPESHLRACTAAPRLTNRQVPQRPFRNRKKSGSPSGTQLRTPRETSESALSVPPGPSLCSQPRSPRYRAGLELSWLTSPPSTRRPSREPTCLRLPAESDCREPVVELGSGAAGSVSRYGAVGRNHRLARARSACLRYRCSPRASRRGHNRDLSTKGLRRTLVVVNVCVHEECGPTPEFTSCEARSVAAGFE